MKYALALEAIGADRAAYAKLKRHGLAQIEPGRESRYLGKLNHRQPWVAEITGGRYIWLDRRFLKGQRDYRNSNSVGSRGIMIYYLLDEGPLYEVFQRLTWTHSDRYYCRIVAGRLERITQEEVDRCLRANAG